MDTITQQGRLRLGRFNPLGFVVSYDFMGHETVGLGEERGTLEICSSDSLFIVMRNLFFITEATLVYNII